VRLSSAPEQALASNGMRVNPTAMRAALE